MFRMKKRGIIIIILFLLIIGSIFYFFLRIPRCDTSGCFEANAIDCKKSKIVLVEANGSMSEYIIRGREGKNCVLDVKLLRIAGLSSELRNKFEGKEMRCNIPKNEFSRMRVEKMADNLDYCKGPLREEIYDVVIKKLYKLVVRDMNTVLEEIERVI